MIGELQEDVAATILADPSLNGLIADRCYPNGAPQGANYPYVVYSSVSITSDYDISAPTDLFQQRLQFDCRGKNGATTSGKFNAIAVATAIVSLFNGKSQTLNNRTVVYHCVFEDLREGIDNVGEDSEEVFLESLDLTFYYKG